LYAETGIFPYYPEREEIAAFVERRLFPSAMSSCMTDARAVAVEPVYLAKVPAVDVTTA
jgi:hypothetical protein